MNALSLNSLWSYLQSLSLTTSNKKWLAEHLLAAANEEAISKENLTLPSSLNRAYIKDGEVKLDIATETVDLEEARKLLHRVIDLEYSLP